MPFKGVRVEVIRRIEAEVDHLLVAADAIAEVIELDLGGILAEDLEVDLIPRIAVIRACVSEERGDAAVILDGLHADLVAAVAVRLLAAELAARIRDLVLRGIVVDRQLHRAVFERDVVLVPEYVERITVRPAVRRLEDSGLTLLEVNGKGVTCLRLRCRRRIGHRRRCKIHRDGERCCASQEHGGSDCFLADIHIYSS